VLCKNGLHPLDTDADYYWSKGRRACKGCQRANSQRYHSRLRREWEARQAESEVNK
jgi:hypothetical protein